MAWRGSHDNSTQISLIFGRGEDLPKSYGGWAKETNTIPNDDPVALAKFFLCGVGYCVRKGMSMTGTQGTIKMLCIAVKYSLAPHLPADEKIAGNDAQLEFMKDVWGFMNARISNDRWTEVDEEKYADAKALGGILHEYAWLPATLEGFTGPVPGEATCPGMQAVLIFLTPYFQPGTSHVPALAFVTTYIGLAKRGTITDSKLDTINEAMRLELGYDLRMSVDHIQKVYSYFGKYIDETNAETVFSTWAQDMQGYSLRVQITMNQASGGGLTAINIIKSAVKAFPDFAWPTVCILLPTDVTNATNAITAIGDNQFYGFKNDLSQIASTKYKSLAYVAKELLKRYGGPDYGLINNYAGWTRNPLHKARLDQLIQDYNPGLDDAAIVARQAEGAESYDALKAAIGN